MADTTSFPAPEEPPDDITDLMGDPVAPPPAPARRDTSSTITSETCRICRSEATSTEPLFHPCKCSGSIKYVHQECLMEWLSHSHKKHCELCKTPFRFTKLYNAQMPSQLPWNVFIKTAAVHLLLGLSRLGRTLLVATVWAVVIPWVVRWVWRWLFWVADAAWARDAFVAAVMRQRGGKDGSWTQMEDEKAGFGHWFWSSMNVGADGGATGPISLRIAKALFGFGNESISSADTSTSPASSASFTWPLTTPSLLSSFPHLANATPSPRLNRLLLDVLEGQIVTCVVITGFILVFLIREWVVQQQPLVNVEHIGNVQQQLQNAADRLQEGNERLQRQRALLDEARKRIEPAISTLYGESGDERMDALVKLLEESIDSATRHLRIGGEMAKGYFATAAVKNVRVLLRVSQATGTEELQSVLYRKLSSYSDEEKVAWMEVIEAEENRESLETMEEGADGETTNGMRTEDEAAGEEGSIGDRPAIPDRDLISRATEIQRMLTEQGDQLRDAQKVSASALQESEEAVVSEEPQSASAHAQLDVAASDAPGKEADEALTSDHSFDPMPITNAGPDAKVNIKRSGKGRMRAVPAPQINRKMVDDDEAFSKLKDEVNKEMDTDGTHFNPSASSSESKDETSTDSPTLLDNPAENNPFHPEGTLPERRNSESLGERVASIIREEFGLDEAEELEAQRQAGVQTEPDHGNTNNEQAEPPPSHGLAQQGRVQPPTFLQKLADWFWGDIEPPQTPDALPPAPEQQLQGDNEGADGGVHGQEAPFVPIRNGQPVIETAEEDVPVPPAQPDAADEQAHDPEVFAAAQEAGLDAEAIEDAEDLEGIFELLGLQGPIIGLFQTSAFCMLLVACTIGGAVVAPYLFGKLVLSFLSSPVYFLVKMPLQTASFVADLVVDVTLVTGAWITMVLALSVEFLLSAAKAWAPALYSFDSIETLMEFATTIAANAGGRLQGLVTTAFTEPLEESADWSWAIMWWSAHAHAELNTIGNEVNGILTAVGTTITRIVETISSGHVVETCWSWLKTASYLPGNLSQIFANAAGLQQYMRPVVSFAKDLSRGALTFSTPESPADPSLVFWSTSDRALATATGYAALAVLAALYVALDTPVSRSASGRQTEKAIRDGLRQSGGVLKVILIISIEMLVFPLYCGMLLDLAFLPLFRDASLAQRWQWAGEKPYIFCFVHWFVGTCYMFHFALFVGMCRKILRKGVLWFVRDPDDPTFHPVRDVLERNVATQLRKIAFSALVYGALVILCLGGVVWTCVRLLEGIFPVVWASTEPALEFPVNLFLYNFITPLLIKVLKPTDAMSGVYAWWLRRCARALRLSHFLFDERRKQEEGCWRHKTWWAALAVWERPTLDEQGEFSNGAYFHRDGKYVLTPCNDQYRPPKPGEAFLHVEDDDVYIADKDGKKNDHFAKVYVPPLFRIRVSLFMGCLWLFSAITGLCATIVPLVLGRTILGCLMVSSTGVNDIYAYSIGAYSLATAVFMVVKGRPAAKLLGTKAKAIDIAVWIGRTKRFGIRILKCAYVYGFIGIVMPFVFALVLQFYLIAPLHTWTASMHEFDSTNSTITNTTTSFSDLNAFSSTATNTSSNTTSSPTSVFPDTTFHIMQGYALGLVYGRIVMRLILTAPASRAAEAFRRITADGYTNPNPRLATRFVVLPGSLLSLVVLVLPPLAVKLALAVLRIGYTSGAFHNSWLSDALVQTKIYRYSYPSAASLMISVLAIVEVARATKRWRARIRDEVYLVGERLHNFGERRPPDGSRSVVRKER